MKLNLRLSVPSLDDIKSKAKETASEVLDRTIGKIVHAIPSIVELPYPSTAVILDVKGYSQWSSYTCGVIASWSIIHALGEKISLSKWVTTCHKYGCSRDIWMDMDQLKKALNSIGLNLYTKRFRKRNQVKNLIDAGQPIFFGDGDAQGGHWMYVYGYSARYVYVGNRSQMCGIKSEERWAWGYFEQELHPRELYIINL